jgi:hypothetical protein
VYEAVPGLVTFQKKGFKYLSDYVGTLGEIIVNYKIMGQFCKNLEVM